LNADNALNQTRKKVLTFLVLLLSTVLFFPSLPFFPFQRLMQLIH
tara:strand:- start:175 stop:309 length:135 start_codon:yes stop_codon:yes gene_type:complete